MSDIYTIDFDPSKLSYQQEELGMRFADLDTACELMKKEEKMKKGKGSRPLSSSDANEI